VNVQDMEKVRIEAGLITKGIDQDRISFLHVELTKERKRADHDEDDWFPVGRWLQEVS
jgi:hypothetical protein